MPAVLLPEGKQQFFTTPGVPAVGYKLMTWAAGTTTPQATWADAGKIAANANPIILDARGEAVIFWDGAYKIQLQDASGAPVWPPIDNVTSAPAPSASLIPTVDNSFSLGSATFSWANVFVGANHAPALDTASGNISYFARTAAEIAAGVTPTNFSYVPGDVRRFGAVGNNTADDTAACNNALKSSATVFFQPGLIFKITAALVVPTTCTKITGLGSLVNGPGAASAVDGFFFTGFYQGAGAINFASNRYQLPGVTNCRYAFNFTAAAFINVESDLAQYCTDGVHVDSTSPTLQYCVELDIDIKNISKCTNGFNMISNSGSGNGIQGCHFKSNYVNGCTNAIGGTFNNANAIFTFNYFDITVIDGNGAPGTCFGINYNLVVNASANAYRVPGGAINLTGAPTAYVNVGTFSRLEILYFSGGQSMDYFAWPGFLAAQPIPTVSPGAGTLTVNVATTGSDATGNGSVAAPYLTVQKAISLLQALDCIGKNIVISLGVGTYASAITFDTSLGYDPQAQLIIQPAGAVAVTLSGGISCLGAGSKVTLQNGTGTLTVTTAGVTAQQQAVVNINGIVFGTCAGPHMQAQSGATINIQANYTISGGAPVHVQTTLGGTFICSGRTVTLTGTPAFSSIFANCSQGGSNQDWTSSIFSGAATGTRYQVTLNGTINTTGGGATFLPGSIAGVSGTGGQYA